MSLVCLSIAGALWARIETEHFSLRLPQPDGAVVERIHEAPEGESPRGDAIEVPHPRGGPYAAICPDKGPCITLDRLIAPRRSGAPVVVERCPEDGDGETSGRGM